MEAQELNRTKCIKNEKQDKATDGLPKALDAEQELLYKLKVEIDQRGSYAYRLNEITAGYGVGRSVAAMTGIEIENKFADAISRRKNATRPQESCVLVTAKR